MYFLIFPKASPWQGLKYLIWGLKLTGLSSGPKRETFGLALIITDLRTRHKMGTSSTTPSSPSDCATYKNLKESVNRISKIMWVQAKPHLEDGLFLKRKTYFISIPLWHFFLMFNLENKILNGMQARKRKTKLNNTFSFDSLFGYKKKFNP